MALNLKNPEVERLATEVAEMTGESKTEAIRMALVERQARLLEAVGPRAGTEQLRSFFEGEIWAALPAEARGKPISKREREEILGYGEGGV